jgi:hypothetical protein
MVIGQTLELVTDIIQAIGAKQDVVMRGLQACG